MRWSARGAYRDPAAYVPAVKQRADRAIEDPVTCTVCTWAQTTRPLGRRPGSVSPPNAWTGCCSPALPMPIASLVVTLDDREPLRQGALGRLVADARVDLGAARGAYLPIVVDTVTAQEGEELVESLLATPGVLRVDVVGIDFSLDGTSPAPPDSTAGAGGRNLDDA